MSSHLSTINHRSLSALSIINHSPLAQPILVAAMIHLYSSLTTNHHTTHRITHHYPSITTIITIVTTMLTTVITHHYNPPYKPPPITTTIAYITPSLFRSGGGEDGVSSHLWALAQKLEGQAAAPVTTRDVSLASNVGGDGWMVDLSSGEYWLGHSERLIVDSSG